MYHANNTTSLDPVFCLYNPPGIKPRETLCTRKDDWGKNVFYEQDKVVVTPAGGIAPEQDKSGGR